MLVAFIDNGSGDAGSAPEGIDFLLEGLDSLRFGALLNEVLKFSDRIGVHSFLNLIHVVESLLELALKDVVFILARLHVFYLLV